MRKLLLLLALLLANVSVQALVTISHQEIMQPDEHVRNKVLKAAVEGVYYLEIPKPIQQFTKPTTQFAKTFPQEDKIKNLRFEGKFNGYFDRRPEDQVRSFYLQNHLWTKAISQPVQNFAQLTKQYQDHVVKVTFETLVPHIPLDLVNKLTSGACEGKARYYLSLNNYDTKENAIGLSKHKDFGFLTFLFIDKKSLFIEINGEWVEVEPKEGSFVVFIANALQIFVNDKEKCNAVWHLVKHISDKEGRISYAVASMNHPNAKVYKTHKDGTYEAAFESSDEYLAYCFKNLYGKK